ncbi:MAG: HK97 family phage prohead protease [Bacilli bacterium]
MKKYNIFSRGLKVNDSKRDGSDDAIVITGRAIVFDEYQRAIDYWGDVFYERINSKIRNSVETENIHLLYNHDYGTVLGRSGVNVDIELNGDGLDFSWTVPNTEKAREIATLVRAGIIDGCSFGFYITDENWEEKDGTMFRTINAIDLREITITPIPFYESTYVRESDRNALPRVRDLKPEETPIEPEPDIEPVDELDPELRDALQTVTPKFALELLSLRFGEDADVHALYEQYVLNKN